MQFGHFEVVHTGARRFHARFVANNGEIVWWTESYGNSNGPNQAIRLIKQAVANMPGEPGDYRTHPVVDERPSP